MNRGLTSPWSIPLCAITLLGATSFECRIAEVLEAAAGFPVAAASASACANPAAISPTSRVARQAKQEVDAIEFGPVDQLLAGEAGVAACRMRGTANAPEFRDHPCYFSTAPALPSCSRA